MFTTDSTRIDDYMLTPDQSRFLGAVVIGEGPQVPFVTSDGDARVGTLALLVSPTSLWAYAANDDDGDGGDDGTYYLVGWDGEKWAEATSGVRTW